MVKSRNTFDITDDISLIQIAKKLAVEFKDNFYIEEKPYKRIVMKFPILKVKELISSKQLLYEEKIQMHSIQKELFIDLKKITEIKFYKNICLFDVIKLQRFFTILFFALFEYIETEKLLDSKLFWRSIIPSFDKIYFLKILEDLFGQTKANDLLDLLSWNPNSNKIFDIQYYPILNIDNLIVLPLGILCNSNLTRNVLQSTNYRFDSDDSNDPIGKLLEESLKSVSSLVKRNFSYNYQGKNGEIDIIAIIENQLFIFECKNSLHPTSSFELRTSYESIKKGVKQLNTFQTLWKEEDFKNYISRRINLSIPIQIYRCIVTGNKMFGGWQAEGINVIPIHELINVINTGKISVKEFDLGEQTLEGITFKLWSKDNFNVNDIIDYIENNSLHQCFFLSMETQKQNIHIGSVNITKNRYMLNMEKFLIEAFCRFRLVDNE